MSALFLHIGSHKTGTTSIQRACSHLPSGNRDGVKYLDVRPSGTQVVGISGTLENFRARILLDAADRVFRPEGQKRLIASDESFFWISEPDTVHKLAALLHERFSSVTILCYLRRQDRLALSHRRQVSDGMPAARFYGVEATPLPRYQPHFQNYFDYATKLSTIWASAFGKQNVQVVPYDKITRKGADVVADFAHRTGASLDISTPIRANRSMKGSRTLVGLKLMEMGLPAPRRRKILENLPAAGQFLPTRAEAQAFVAHFAGANRNLARDWTWKGAPFTFDRSFGMYPKTTPPGWSDNDVEMIMEAIVEGMRHRGDLPASQEQ